MDIWPISKLGSELTSSVVTLLSEENGEDVESGFGKSATSGSDCSVLNGSDGKVENGVSVACVEGCGATGVARDIVGALETSPTGSITGEAIVGCTTSS